MAEDGEDVDRQEVAYETACDLYEELANCLSKAIAALRKRERSGASLTDAEENLLKDHQKALLMTLGFETQLFRKHGPTHRPGAILDLAAARREVAGRLARLAERSDA